MSLPSSPDYLFRADPMHLPPIDDCNIFDQVFDPKLYEVDDAADDDASKDAPNEQDYFATEAIFDDYPRLPSLCGSTSLETSIEQPSPQPWRNGLWCLNQNTLNIEKTRRTGVGTISGAQLFNEQELLIQNPPSPSASPTKISTKRFVTSPNAAKYLHKANSHLPLSREATFSPSPLYAQLPLQAKMQQVETWQQDFKNFTIQNPRLRSDASPETNLPRDQSIRIAHFNNVTMANNAAYQPRQLPVDGIYHKGLAEKAIDPGLIHRGSDDLMAQTQLPQSSQSALPNTLDQRFGLNWTTDSLDSSNGSHQSSYDTLPPSLSSGISSSGIQNMMMTQNQLWWPQDMTPATPAWSPNPKESSTGIAAPTPKRAATHSYVENMADRTEGLGIHYPDFNCGELHDHSTFFTSIEPKTPTTNLYSPKRTQPMSQGIPPVPPLPFPTPRQGTFHNSSPFSTPLTIRQAPIRPHSPPLSPLSIDPRSSRRHNRSPSRSEHTSYNHHRRKSIHKPGPIKSTSNLIIDDHLPSATGTTSSTTARARSRSQSKPPRTPRTPKAPSSAHPAGASANPHHNSSNYGNGHGNGFNSIDFVNFTARDSAKLLSDVAPSGSSKTRARRDAEAKEKRKKLGEAALRAVSSVGGDVEALRRAILA